MFICSVPSCNCTNSDPQKLLDHILCTTVHNFQARCIYPNCSAIFNSANELDRHVTSKHKYCQEKTDHVFLCEHIECSDRNFTTFDIFYFHILKAQDNITCVFLNCAYTTDKKENYIKHVNYNHKYAKGEIDHIRPNLIQKINRNNTHQIEINAQNEINNEYNPSNNDSSFASQSNNSENDMPFDIKVKEYMANLYLKYQTTHLIQQSVLDELFDDFMSLIKMSNRHLIDTIEHYSNIYNIQNNDKHNNDDNEQNENINFEFN